MAELFYYQNLLKQYKAQLAQKQKTREHYLEIAEEIKQIYERMSEDKSTVKSYRRFLKTFRNEKYGDFKGTLYKEYKTKMKVLLENYNIVINNIDTNMDRLNKEIAKYENKAYECDGVIETLRAAINTVTHTIENWIN